MNGHQDIYRRLIAFELFYNEFIRIRIIRFSRIGVYDLVLNDESIVKNAMEMHAIVEEILLQ
jgi:hypothetical protein